MRIYFRLATSFMGEVYFRVSKHLQVPPSYVLANKFNPDVKFLIIKYTAVVRAEQEEIKNMNKEMNKK